MQLLIVKGWCVYIYIHVYICVCVCVLYCIYLLMSFTLVSGALKSNNNNNTINYLLPTYRTCIITILIINIR